MRRAASGSPWIVLVTLALAAASGARAEPDRRADLEALYRLSGIETHLASMRGTVLRAAETQGHHLPPSVEEVIRRELAPEKLRGAFMKRLETEYEPRAIHASLAWLRSETGRRLVALEERAGAEDMATFQRHARKLHEAPPPAPREELVERLDRVTRASEFILELQTATTLSALIAVNATLPTGQRLDPAALEDLARQQMEASRGAVEAYVRVFNLYAYRDAADEELVRYLRFLETEAGRWYLDATRNALAHTLGAFNRELDTALARELATPRDEVAM